MVFDGATGIHERIYRVNSMSIRRKEKEICEFKMDLKNFFFSVLI